MLQAFFLILAGILLLYGGGEALVRGSSALALRLGVTPLIVGLTVVAFGTSTPEFLVSLRAALDGAAPIALGNVVGSNIANIGLILGIAALVRPLSVNAQTFRVDVPIVLVVSCVVPVMLLVTNRGPALLGRVEGGALFLALVVYLIVRVRVAHRETGEVRAEYQQALAASRPGNLALNLVLVIGGLAILAVGARWLVRGAVFVAQFFGMPEAVIGLTVVAIGTSLPELAASVVAAVRKEGDISVGNVLGSNLFNLLGVLGLTAAIRPLGTSGVTLPDYALMIAYALVLIPMARSGARIGRGEGAFLLAVYIVYMAYVLMR